MGSLHPIWHQSASVCVFSLLLAFSRSLAFTLALFLSHGGGAPPFGVCVYLGCFLSYGCWCCTEKGSSHRRTCTTVRGLALGGCSRNKRAEELRDSGSDSSTFPALPAARSLFAEPPGQPSQHSLATRRVKRSHDEVNRGTRAARDTVSVSLPSWT